MQDLVENLGYQLTQVGSESLFIRSNNLFVRINCEDILFAHADGNYSYLFTKEKKYAIKISLKRLMDRLPFQWFTRVHKSYFVRMDRIEKIDLLEHILTIHDKQLPIGKAFKEQILNQFLII